MPLHDPLDPLVRLRARNVEQDLAKLVDQLVAFASNTRPETYDDSPLPLDSLEQEHPRVDSWDIDDWEGGQSEDDGTPQQDLVVEEVHLEEGFGKVLALERVDHPGSSATDLRRQVISSQDDDKSGKASRPGLEDGVANSVGSLVTLQSKVSLQIS